MSEIALISIIILINIHLYGFLSKKTVFLIISFLGIYIPLKFFNENFYFGFLRIIYIILALPFKI